MKLTLKSTVVCIASIFCLQSFTWIKNQISMNYPKIKTSPATDTYFGNRVQDNYRILESTKDSAVQTWIREEKKLCDSVLERIPNKDIIQKELQDVLFSANVQTGFPQASGNRLFFNRSFAKEHIQKLYYKEGTQGQEFELYNTDSINTSNLIYSIDFYAPSTDGKFIAFGISSNGGEQTVIQIIDVENRKLLPEKILRATYGTPFWIPGKYCFFYNQLKEIKSDQDKMSPFENSLVKLHWIKTSSDIDKEVFPGKENNLANIDFPSVYTFPSSDKVIAQIYHGASSYFSLFVASLDDITNTEAHIKWKKVCTPEDKAKTFNLYKHELFLISFKNNPNGTLVKRSLDTGHDELILDAKDEVLDDMTQTKTSIFVKKIKNGNGSLTKMEFGNWKMSDIALPFKGSISIRAAFGTSPAYFNSDNLFFAMESWIRESAIYQYSSASKNVQITNLRPANKYGSPSDLMVKEVEIPSSDGAMIPISIVYSKNIKLDGTTPTILTGYGAYGFSYNNSFSISSLVWIRMGGMYAVAHVRGGGEKGDSWYKGGFKSTKSNSWKDFLTCAEYLIKERYTSPGKLAVKGMSAGGITVGRAITERPDLFKAGILNVAVLNITRLEESGNSQHITEFGTMKDSVEYKYLEDMDVYHHIKPGVKYPSLLVSAGINDARLQWWQPGKAVAKFQEVNSKEDNIILFNISDYGHGGNIDKVKEFTNEYSFLFWQLNHSIKTN
jgi:prolyl oligopeptidase